MKHWTQHIPLLCLLMIVLATATSHAGNPVVRILFYTGPVTVKSGGTTGAARIGQTLSSSDEVVLSGNATLQLSIDGKVIKYTKPMKVRIADAIKRAGTGENLVVANTIRTIAGASGSGRNDRSSVAGATRAQDSSKLITQIGAEVRVKSEQTLSDEITTRTGIENPGEIVKTATTMFLGEAMIILEPRSTAVTHGPITFRWLRNVDVTSYTVTVRDYKGDEIFRTQTTDTTVVWNKPTLAPEAIYTVSVFDPDSYVKSAFSSFHQLTDSANRELGRSEEAIRRELGADNPALPLMLGALLSDYGCYGQAARYYTLGAMKSSEHYNEFMQRACDEYRYNVFMDESEVAKIYRR